MRLGAGVGFIFSRSHPQSQATSWRPSANVPGGMLEPPIANFGVKGIRTAAGRIRAWPDVLAAADLRERHGWRAVPYDVRSLPRRGGRPHGEG